LNIVIIDDEQVIVKGLADMIQKLSADWRIKGTYCDTEEALEQCDWDEVQVALIDINMPRISGISLVAILRERGFETQVIFITAYANFEYAQKAVQLQAIDYILKPVAKQSLKVALKKAEEEYLKREAKLKDQDYIRENLLFLRKEFLGDIMFEKHAYSKEELQERLDRYMLCDKEYSIIALRTGMERSELIACLHRLEKSSYFIYGQRSPYILLLIYDKGKYEDMLCLASRVQNGDITVGYSVNHIGGVEQLAFYYNRLLTQNINKKIKEADKPPQHKESFYAGEEDLTVATRQIIKYIEENYEKKISLKSISEGIYLHPAYVSNVFKKQTGYNVVDFINHYRVIKAKELLSDPQNKIYWVMEQVGFVNQRYFSQVFKKYIGLSPSQYRQSLFLDI
jgi:two-component system response regulator YesN